MNRNLNHFLKITKLDFLFPELKYQRLYIAEFRAGYSPNIIIANSFLEGEICFLSILNSLSDFFMHLLFSIVFLRPQIELLLPRFSDQTVLRLNAGDGFVLHGAKYFL